MEVSKCSIYDLFNKNNGRFIIPVYQRNYDWKKENCETLWDDLTALYFGERNSHFFGSIVHYPESKGHETDNIIIDWQQRITTSYLLLLAMKKQLEKYKKDDAAISTCKWIEKLIVEDTLSGYSKNKLKLKLVLSDNQAFEALVNGSSEITGSRITENYKFFLKKIQNFSVEEISKLFNALRKIFLVSISLDNGDDPQLIFESLNSTGLKLSESDKIRNFVLMGLNSETQDKYYDTYWKKIEENIKKVDQNNCDDFFRSFLTWKTGEFITKTNLYLKFKEFCISNKINSDNIDALLNEVLKSSGWYVQFYKSRESNVPYAEELFRVSLYDTKTIIPIVFDLIKNFELKNLSIDEIRKCLNIIDSYFIRRISSDLTGKSMNKNFASFSYDIEKISNEFKDKNPTYFESYKYYFLEKISSQKTIKFPKNEEFVEKFKSFPFYQHSKKITQYVLSRLSNFNNNEIIDVENSIKNHKLTIEHVMPQNLTDQWKHDLGQNWTEIHANYLHTIGNLTLSAYNETYGNKSFLEKRDLYNEKLNSGLGFKYSNLVLNEYIQKQNKWGEKQILERAQILADKALKIWPYPKKSKYTPDTPAKEITFDDPDNLMGKIILKCSFQNDLVTGDYLQEFYKKMFEYLYNKDSVVLFKNSCELWGNNRSNFQLPIKINDELYIEGKINKNTKLNTLIKLCNIYELDQQDIKFQIVEATIENFKKFKPAEIAKPVIFEMIDNELIDQKEFQKLNSKEYSSEIIFKNFSTELFAEKNSPAFWNNRKKFYKKEFSINGFNFYLTNNWFKEDIERVYEFYSTSLKNKN